MSLWNSPCAACKTQRRKCTDECIFKPYFPANNPHKFAYVHRVFGASNVAKLLNEVNVSQREDAVKSLAYEAEARLRDPVYGCVGLISFLQNKLRNVQTELFYAKKEIASFVGTQAMYPQPPPPPSLPLVEKAATVSSYFSIVEPSYQNEGFNFNTETPFYNSQNQTQTQPFHHQIMLSSPPQLQPNDSFLSQKKIFKTERENL